MSPQDIADLFEETAMLLELKGENPFKVRAYQNAARVLEGLNESLEKLIQEKRLGELKGIGKTLTEQITECVETGKLEFYRELKKEFPASLFDLLRIPGLGAKKVRTLFEKLKISSLDALEVACKSNQLVALEGFGEKTQAKILSGIEFVKSNMTRFLYCDVVDTAEDILKRVVSIKPVTKASLGGSLRRKKEIVQDIDIVCASESPKSVIDHFVVMKDVTGILAQGDTKASIHLKSGLQVDLRVVNETEYPYALHHFTGSKEHNTELRAWAKELGYKLNEYGLFKGDRLISCKSEKELFKALRLNYIPPELREGMGEIGDAKKESFEDLIERRDLKGCFHVHSTYSDGRNSLEEMVQAAEAADFEFVGISDHSQSAFYANGLKEADIDRQHKELDRLEKKYSKIRIFRGIESDVLPDGSLDYPDRVLKRFDFVIGSVHAKFKLSEKEMTERCLRALRNPYCTMLGHPTGRLLLSREGFQIDVASVIHEAQKLGKFVELNANPYRLDVDWRALRATKHSDRLKVCINPDAHDVAGFNDLIFGVNMARKAGLKKENVVTTLSAKAMEKALEQTRHG